MNRYIYIMMFTMCIVGISYVSINVLSMFLVYHSNDHSSPRYTQPSNQEFVPQAHQKLVQVHLSKDEESQTCLTLLSDDVSLPKNLQLAVHSCIPKCMYSTHSMTGSAGFWTSVCGQGETTSSENANKVFQDLLQGLMRKDSVLVCSFLSGVMRWNDL